MLFFIFMNSTNAIKLEFILKMYLKFIHEIFIENSSLIHAAFVINIYFNLAKIKTDILKNLLMLEGAIGKQKTEKTINVEYLFKFYYKMKDMFDLCYHLIIEN